MKYIKLILTTLLLLCLTACTNPSSAKRVLTQAGYTEIQMTGYQFFSCSKDDFFHTGFRAKGPTGIWTNGTVCEGLLFKNSTIRFD